MTLPEKQQLLNCILEVFGYGPEMDSFDVRLEKQKLISFLQAKGVDLKYPFNWYVHGPYSSELASDLYDIYDEASSPDDFDLSLDPDFKRKLEIFRDELETIEDNFGGSNSTEFMEIVGSGAHLLRDFDGVEQALEHLIELKPKLQDKREEIRELLQSIEELDSAT